MSKIKESIKSVFRSLGIDIKLHDSKRTDVGMIVTILNNLDINMVFDVGANCGQYASGIIKLGYNGRIVSFEPLSAAHAKLRSLAKSYVQWEVHDRCAIGNDNCQVEINISRNSESSSLLPMLSSHVEAAPSSKYVAREVTRLFKLDGLSKNYIDQNTKLYIKIDTQGFEWNVLDGASDCLHLAKAVQIELSFVSLYESQHLWREIVERMEVLGFDLWLLLPGFSNYEIGRTLQMDAVFVRHD